MTTPSRVFALIFALLAAVLAGCGSKHPEKHRPKRPVAGDTVTPVFLLGKSWKQKGPVLISARLQVQGPKETEAQLLQLADVPHEIVPRVSLTFFQDDRKLSTVRDVRLKRDC